MYTGPISDYAREAGTNNDLEIAVAGNVTVYSRAVDLSGGVLFSVAVKGAVTSGQTIDIAITPETGDEPVASGLDGAADAGYVVGEGVSTLLTINNSNWRQKTFAPVLSRYGRFKLEGGASNHSSATVKILVKKMHER